MALNPTSNPFSEAFSLIASCDPELIGVILLTLAVTLTSTALAALLGIPLGMLLGLRDFKGRKGLLRLIQTLMGLPPVVAGLIVYLLLSRSGPMGSMALLFTPTAMVLAQFIIIAPIITGLCAASTRQNGLPVLETLKGLGLKGFKTGLILFSELRSILLTSVLAGYGRAVAEVGAVMLVGGNIRYSTRVLTTSIVLETSKGNYGRALALGIILLILSFLVNYVVQLFQERSRGAL
ncbi:MAG: ABC transporter permease [Clostridia bacterium]|nr:ABC transporter permease [Clostridia bacterium]